MSKNVHDFRDTVVVVGSAILTGFMDGSPITSEPNEDKYTQHVGADGQVTYNRSANETGTFTFTLKIDSSSVPILDGLRKGDESFPVSITDSKNGITVTGEDCRIAKTPTFTRGAEVEGKEYTILAAYYKED